jgi:hypothetical protein
MYHIENMFKKSWDFFYVFEIFTGYSQFRVPSPILVSTSRNRIGVWELKNAVCVLAQVIVPAGSDLSPDRKWGLQSQ